MCLAGNHRISRAGNHAPTARTSDSPRVPGEQSRVIHRQSVQSFGQIVCNAQRLSSAGWFVQADAGNRSVKLLAGLLRALGMTGLTVPVMVEQERSFWLRQIVVWFCQCFARSFMFAFSIRENPEWGRAKPCY
jgi:hypothetical protein